MMNLPTYLLAGASILVSLLVLVLAIGVLLQARAAPAAGEGLSDGLLERLGVMRRHLADAVPTRRPASPTDTPVADPALGARSSRASGSTSSSRSGRSPAPVGKARKSSRKPLQAAADAWLGAAAELPAFGPKLNQDVNGLLAHWEGAKVERSASASRTVSPAEHDAAHSLARYVLVTSDRDLDPERQRKQLQNALEELLRSARLKALHPARGTFYPAEPAPNPGSPSSSSTSSLSRSRSARKKVGAVLTRGLCTEDGRVILDPEIEEMD